MDWMAVGVKAFGEEVADSVRTVIEDAIMEYDRQHLAEHHGQEPVVEMCDYSYTVDTDYSNRMYCPTCWAIRAANCCGKLLEEK